MARLRAASWARVPWMTSSTCPTSSANRPGYPIPSHPIPPSDPGPEPTGCPSAPMRSHAGGRAPREASGGGNVGVSAPRWPCCGQGCRRRLSSLRTEHRWAIGALGCCGSRAYFLPSPHPTRSGAPRGVGTEPPWWAERVGGERGCPRTAEAFGGALGCVQWGWGAAAPGLRVWREGGPSVGL